MYKYKLVKRIEPKLLGNKVVDESKVKGILLKYSIHRKLFTFLGITIFEKRPCQNIVYYKPLRIIFGDSYDEIKSILGYPLCGNRQNPFVNKWYESIDFDDYNLLTEHPTKREIKRNKKGLTGLLEQKPEVFFRDTESFWETQNRLEQTLIKFRKYIRNVQITYKLIMSKIRFSPF